MKHIVLGKKSSRIFAGLVDFLILMASSALVYFTAVVPFTLDQDSYVANTVEMNKLYKDSGLFFTKEDGSHSGKTAFNKTFTKIEHLYDVDIKYGDTVYKHQNLSRDLYTYYTQKYINYDAEANLTKEVYFNDVLKIGSEESNIKSVNMETFEISCIDPNKYGVAMNYFLKQFEAASYHVDKCSGVITYKNANNAIMGKVIAFSLPVLIGFGLIYQLVIPLCNKENKTIGKFIFKLGVISSEGYSLKKWKMIPRALTYIIVEVIGGILTFGGLFLITYTMFLFNKKRRSIHDFVAGSCVISSAESIYFNNKKEEHYYISKGFVKDE